MKKFIRQIGMSCVRIFGSEIRDAVDGAVLGRALLFSWCGRLYLIGYEGTPLRPVCVAQSSVKYWRVTVGFTRASVPDFPHMDKIS